MKTRWNATSLFAVVSTRLLRRGTEAGYVGRVPVAEVATVTPAVREAILAHGEAGALRSAMMSAADFVPLRTVAAALVQAGVTDEAEVRRTLGD